MIKKQNEPVKRLGNQNSGNGTKAVSTPFQKDRIGGYFKQYAQKFVFSQFSEQFLEKAKLGEDMKDVPIPLRKEDLQVFAGGAGVAMPILAENMALLVGADPRFKYAKNYVLLLQGLFGDKICKNLTKKGRREAEKEDLEQACIYFRGALSMKPDDLHAMYSYAKVCRDMYTKSQDQEYTGRFKAESMEYFERLTTLHPKFPQAYYYLGYAYLNMGLYIKADLTWKEFLRLTHNGKDRKEIKSRRKQLAEPVQIEEGYNDILAARYEDGLEKLEPFLDSRFRTWWPLHYYLGIGYRMTGQPTEAISSLRHVLTLNASHLETMEELVTLYEAAGDEENRSKYEKKLNLIRKQMAEEA